MANFIMDSFDGQLSMTHTAAGFPENGWLVKASTMYCFIGPPYTVAMTSTSQMAPFGRD